MKELPKKKTDLPHLRERLIVTNNTMSILVIFAPDFNERLSKTLEDELRVAAAKWGVKLDQDQKQEVRNHSLEQLKRRMSALSKGEWDLERKIVIQVTGGGHGSMTLDQSKPIREKGTLVRTKSGWALTDEETDSAVTLRDFPEFLEELIFSYLRTGVFYGVGSYVSGGIHAPIQ